MNNQSLYPCANKIEVCFSYHFRLACLSPYKDFNNLHTWLGLEHETPRGIVMYTSSCKSLCKKALFTFNWWMCQLKMDARANNVLTVVILATDENVSNKSSPFTWLYLLATVRHRILSRYRVSCPKKKEEEKCSKK